MSGRTYFVEETTDWGKPCHGLFGSEGDFRPWLVDTYTTAAEAEAARKRLQKLIDEVAARQAEQAGVSAKRK